MKNLIKRELLFIVGNTYLTKFQTGERFTITRDPYIRHKETDLIIGTKTQAFGVYENSQDLGECPLNIDRLIPDFEEIIEEVERCEHCKQIIKHGNN